MFGTKETQERLARLEAGLEEHRRLASERQAATSARLLQLGQATTEQLAELSRSIVAQLAQLGETGAAHTTQVETRIAEMRESIDRIAAELTSNMAGLQQSAGKSGTQGKRVAKNVGRLSSELKRLQAKLARLGGTFDVQVDARFFEVADPLKESRRTMLGFDRLFTLWQAAGNVAPLALPVVEVGTFRGGSAALLAEALREAGNGAAEVHVVDTFEGHLDHSFTAHDAEAQRGKFRNTSYDEVREFLGAYPGVHVHQGDALSVISTWPERQYSLVHIDVDLYGPTRDCLDYFGPRLAVGGVLVMDDFDSPTCPGVSVAVGEFLAGMPGFQRWKLQAEQVVLVRTSPNGAVIAR